jgi:hypothetical protein
MQVSAAVLLELGRVQLLGVVNSSSESARVPVVYARSDLAAGHGRRRTSIAHATDADAALRTLELLS